MEKVIYNSCFDIIGPIMLGPSSSHTAGVASIGKFAYDLLGNIPESVHITFYDSFAETYRGHGTDKAILGGLLGMGTDDPGIRYAFDLAEDEKMHVTFQMEDRCPYFDHPNTLMAKIRRGSKRLDIGGASLGGGLSKIFLINGHLVDLLLNAEIDMEWIKETYL
ncbi:serine dehydratase beta chain [Siminovitchia sp. 179-K 8D1 HS]|uniref:serine dehydratase beta chain n=1 Tax=Siminovitchia sp. 179-K 8D1 HS TaxID=3142385 RepID=UPI0039A045C2